MRDHAHEWYWKPWFEVRKFVCTAKDCKETMGMQEAERRLNATERLSAEQANEASLWIKSGYGTSGWGSVLKPQSESIYDDLRAYVAARDGESHDR